MFGLGNRSTANLSPQPGTTIIVTTSVDYGSTNAPSVGGGITAESNNLTLEPPACPIVGVDGGASPAIVFTESNSTGVTSICACQNQTEWDPASASCVSNCGQGNQACCGGANGTCFGGLVCTNGVCGGCGGLGQPCCESVAGNTCNPNLTCADLICHANSSNCAGCRTELSACLERCRSGDAACQCECHNAQSSCFKENTCGVSEAFMNCSNP